MAISVGLVSVAVGIGVPVFYESQIDNAVSSARPIVYIILIVSFNCSRASSLALTEDGRTQLINVSAGQARQHSALLPLQWNWRT